MSGYIRQDTTSQISNTNVVDADPLNNEFDALSQAFSSTVGHKHDGTASEGFPITKIGPSQDIIATVSTLHPKTDNVVDLGTSSLEFKDLWIDGTANIDNLVADVGTVGGAAITTVTNTQTLTNKTLTSPVINGGIITGITDLAVADGGTGSSTGAGALVNLGLTATAAELNTLDNVTATGTALIRAADAAAGRAAINAVVPPTISVGLGEWRAITSTVGVALALPAGGQWAYFAVLLNAGLVTNAVCSVANGGTTIGTATGGQNWSGFAWRVQ